MDEELRAAKVLTRARRLYILDYPTRAWAGFRELALNPALMRLQAAYLRRAEDELLAEGKIDSVDQS